MSKETQSEVAEVMSLYNDETQRWDISIEQWLSTKVQQLVWLLKKCGLSEPSKISSQDWRWLLDVTATASRAGSIKEEYAVRIRGVVEPLIAEIEALKLQLKQKADAELKAELQAFFATFEKS